MKEITTNVKLIIGGLVILVIALMFGGKEPIGNNDSSPAPIVTETITEEPTTPAVSVEDEFLYAIAMSDEEFYMMYNDADLIKLGWAICESLDAGVSYDDIILMAVDNGLDSYGVGTVIGASVSNLCTQHYSSAVAWLESYGY